jgi:uncharacterized protein (DUF302 family)
MLPVGFDESVLRVTEGLNREGSGIITEIDVKATLILGACHSALAYEALQIEDKVGTMLACNVVVPSLRRAVWK